MKTRQEESGDAAPLHFVRFDASLDFRSQSCLGPDAPEPRADSSCFALAFADQITLAEH